MRSIVPVDGRLSLGVSGWWRRRVLRRWLCAVQPRNKDVASPIRAVLQGRDDKMLLFGLGGAAMVNWIGSVAQGWPMLSMMRYGDELMMVSLMGIALTLVVVVGSLAMLALKSDEDSTLPPEGVEEMILAELEHNNDRRHRRHRRHRRRDYSY